MTCRSTLFSAALLMISVAGLSGPAGADDVLEGWTRTGSVYQRIDLDGGTARTCAAICNGDQQCRAWVWTLPGLEGPDARCGLLSASETPRPAPGRVTGLSEEIAAWYNAAAERPPTEREIEALLETRTRLPH
jgi:hypothetical protein